MKYRLFILVMIFSSLFFSCTKSSEQTKTNTTLQAADIPTVHNAPLPVTVTFYSGDTLHDYSGNDSAHLSELQLLIYSDQSYWNFHTSAKSKTPGSDPWDRLDLVVIHNNLSISEQEYTTSNASCDFTQDQFHRTVGSLDSAILNITSIHDNLADGTFVNRSADGVSLIINNGVFKNVPIVKYQN